MIVRRSKICYGDWFTIAKTKKIHEAILEIAVNTHSPFCPKLVDYSACVPPALQNGFVNSFDFDNFELHKHSYTQFWSQTLLDFFSLWVTLATLGEVWQYPSLVLRMYFEFFKYFWGRIDYNFVDWRWSVVKCGRTYWSKQIMTMCQFSLIVP